MCSSIHRRFEVVFEKGSLLRPSLDSSAYLGDHIDIVLAPVVINIFDAVLVWRNNENVEDDLIN